MIVFFGCIVFTLLLIFYIFVPVRVESGEEKTRLAYLYERKEVIYENLRDLSFEYKAGKLGDADFESLRNSMAEDAAAVLAEIDQLEKGRGGRSRRRPSRKAGCARETTSSVRLYLCGFYPVACRQLPRRRPSPEWSPMPLRQARRRNRSCAGRSHAGNGRVEQNQNQPAGKVHLEGR